MLVIGFDWSGGPVVDKSEDKSHHVDDKNVIMVVGCRECDHDGLKEEFFHRFGETRFSYVRAETSSVEVSVLAA